ncbi:MAG: hypothetical protein HOI80_03225 [Alphaproteobacteria bacterium]|jgi:hypothetical protein|nr:hypothetical protein [Alphaproteobacteria bacterium]MBT5389497.1 hypothetical protein [Alphaproteobacteria bacterium]MBT5540484.1 hypothetical protein [Alphaproteobacteria bacterium]MBT5654496.1 hypothetical protein [Alphaproteobacteria bacterium]
MNSLNFSNENCLIVFPTLARQIGVKDAIVLQQIHYWLNPKLNKNVFEGCHWVYNTYDQWQQQFPFWQIRTIRRIINRLEEKNFLRSFVSRSLKNAKYYTINYDSIKTLKQSHEDTTDTSNTKKQRVVKSASHVDNLAVPYGQKSPLECQNWYDQLSKLASSYIDTDTTQNILTPPHTPPQSVKIDQKEGMKEEYFYKNMIEIWNQQVQSQLKGEAQTIRFTKDRIGKLQRFFSDVFNNNPAKWRSYCSRIKDCRFLMGESPSGFQVTLDWALKHENAQKVLEGKIYDKPQVRNFKEKPWSKFEKELIKHCEDYYYPASWFEVCKLLAQNLGQAVFLSWFKDMSLKSLSPDSISVSVKNAFIKDYIVTHYYRDFERALKEELPEMTNIDIHVGEPNTKAN